MGSRFLRDTAVRTHACCGIRQNSIPGVSGFPLTVYCDTARTRLGHCGKNQGTMAMSISEERAIVKKYIGGFPWLMVIWGLGGFLLWVSLWPLAYTGQIPLWLGSIVATVILSACYLPTHEAQHGNIARPNTPLRWFNELVGHVSVFPLIFPYRLHRAIHLKHHALPLCCNPR